MGTPDFAVPALDALIAAGHDVVAAYTQPPRPAGRGKALAKSPVHRRAEAAGIDVHTPITLKSSEEQSQIAALGADCIVVAAYGLILPRPVLDSARHGCINIHASLLPRWRGAAPVQRAILAGDAVTGISIMQMAAGLDTGPVLMTRETPVDARTAGDLTADLAAIGAAMIVEVLGDPDRHPPVPQPDIGVTYAAKIEKHEARLDFTRSAVEVERQVRAFNPWPGAFFEHGGERLRVHSAAVVEAAQGGAAAGTVTDDALTIACGSGAIRPLLVQRAGRAAMATGDLLRGFEIPAGSTLC